MSHAPTIRAFLLGCVALGLALWGQRVLATDAYVEAGILYGAALLLFVGALPRLQFQTPLLVARREATTRPPWIQIALLLIGLLLGVIALQRIENVERPPLIFWQLHLASVAVFMLGAWLLDWQRLPSFSFRGDELRTRWRQQAPQLLALAVILLVAIVFRLWRFTELPFGTWYDEAENALQALRILETPGYYPIFVNSIHAPAHYLYLIATAFHYADVSTESVRLVSVVMGIGTVAAGYLVGRELFGRAAGLILAFLLAVSRWQVNFSRIGMYNASTPLFALLTVGFLLRAFRSGRYRDYMLAGAALGLGLCFYAAFQLFVAAVGLFVLLLLLCVRGFWRRHWSGLAIFAGMVLLIIAPVLKFAYEKPEMYFERTRDTSIFANKQPEERIPALLENTRKHLLMFNYWGDPNGRHNLPARPMLDPYSAALFVLGVGITIWRLFRPPGRLHALFLLLWLGITLLGGILSLDFEAPQSLRAIGSQPVAYLLASLPLVALWQTWRQQGGRYFPNAVAVPLCALLLVTGYSNFHTYFFEQANDFASWNAFSTPETIAAERLKTLSPDTDAYVISFFHGHPTLNFLARGVKPYHRLETTDHLPLPWNADRSIALIINADSRSLFAEAQRYYPNAYFEEIKPPFGGPTVIYYALLSPQDLASVQGLTARYFSDSEWTEPALLTRQEPELLADWESDAPLPLPFSAEWQGVLRAESYGPYQFFLQTPDYAELYIGEERILAGTDFQSAGLVLAQGNHNLRVRAKGGSGTISLSWRPPDRSAEIIPARTLYVPPVASNGLLGRYFSNGEWQGPEAFAKIDPQLKLYFHVPTLARPYTVEWLGKIAIPQNGLYRFGLESIDESTLWIDEQLITEATERNIYTEGSVELTAGLHDLRIRYTDRTDHTHINFYWVPPGMHQQIVPSAVLFPPQANYERITLPSLSALAFDAGVPAPPAVLDTPLTGYFSVLDETLTTPRGLAAGLDGTLFVAESTTGRVLHLAGDGQLLAEVTHPTRPFIEPFDLAVDRLGQLYVLDASQGSITIFDGQGNYLRDLPVTEIGLERARGLFVDEQGRIWVAHTPAGRVIALDQSGAVVQDIAVWPGADSQPVDIVVGTDGTIFVTDAALHKLVRFAPDGRRLLAWDIPVTNSLDGSHLAVDGAGLLYLTQPEMATVAQLSPEGEQIGLWLLHNMARAGSIKPIGITVDELGNVWVADVAGGQIVQIKPQSDEIQDE